MSEYLQGPDGQFPSGYFPDLPSDDGLSGTTLVRLTASASMGLRVALAGEANVSLSASANLEAQEAESFAGVAEAVGSFTGTGPARIGSGGFMPSRVIDLDEPERTYTVVTRPLRGAAVARGSFGGTAGRAERMSGSGEVTSTFIARKGRRSPAAGQGSAFGQFMVAVGRSSPAAGASGTQGAWGGTVGRSSSVASGSTTGGAWDAERTDMEEQRRVQLVTMLLLGGG